MSRYDDDDDTGGYEPRKRRGRGSRRRRIFGWLAVIVTLLVTGTSLVAYASYLSTLHSIETFSTANLGNHQPPVYNASENILLVGSDSRAGPNQHFGRYVQGQRSDTMLLVHIRPDHKGAVVVSLPRDTEVPIYACKPDGLGDPGQQAGAPGQTEMLNATFAFGGPPCLWLTVQHLTGVRITHYVGLTFSGFEKIINDIGGVNVCLPEAIHDPKSGIDLSAGRHHVLGGQALAFWRERYVGEGSDLQRIQRQQYLMAGLVQELKTGGLLSDYPKLYGVLRDAARAMTVDQGLSLGDMVSLAEDLRSLTIKSVQFVTVPNLPDPADPNRVIWEQPQAKRLFRAIAHDYAIPRPGPAPAPTSTPSPAATVSPRKVQVEVLNGNGVPGAAGQAASDLTSKGFDVVGASNASNTGYTDSVIEYSSSTDMPMVNTLKAQLSSVQVQQVPSLAPGTIYLIIGSSFTGLRASPSPGASSSSNSPGPSSSSKAGNLAKSYGGIKANTNICNDSGAFVGPDNPADGT